MLRKLFVILALLPLLAGCHHPAPPAPVPVVTAAPSAPTPPYVLHIPGISGESFVDHSMVRGLKASLPPGSEIEIYDWTEHDAGIPALQAYKRNHAEAIKIAAMITNHAKANPGQPIFLTCHSGGAGLVTWALEALPPDINVDAVLYIAPALSPSYDLSKALAHVKGTAYVFWSDRDTVILSAGTKVFGTIDGLYVAAAGNTSFQVPEKADKTQYAKLHQIPYDPAWVKYYNDGDHIGPMETPFAREVLGPVLQGKTIETKK